MIELAHMFDAWAATLWRASWQGSLTLLLVWSLCRMLPAMPARFQSWLWRLALLKFLVALIWFVPVELPLLPKGSSTVALQSMPAAAEPSLIAMAPSVESVAVIQPEDRMPAPLLLLLIAWTAGVVWQSSRIWKDWRDVQRLRNRCYTIDNPKVRGQLAAVSQSFGLRSPPDLLQAKGKGSPLLVGILRPAIVIPTTTLHRLDPLECTMVLGHELAHVCRGDLFWSLLAAVARAVFFFHPLVWFAERRLQLAHEIAADELAMDRQQNQPASYASLLVSIVSKLGPDRLHPALAVGTAGSPESLKQRIVAMRFMKCVSPRALCAWGLMVVAFAVLGVVPWKLVAAEPAEKLMRTMKADDFWQQTGAKLKHDDIGFQESNEIRELAGTSDDTTMRIRAYKILADLYGRTRYSDKFSEAQTLEAVAAAFQYLETNVNEQMIAKFRPELGFTHVTTSMRSADEGSVWILIEATDGVLPSGGLNIRWSPTTKTVNKIEHWGVNRNPIRRPGSAFVPPPRAAVVVGEKDAARKVNADDSKQPQFMASLRISQGPPGKEKDVLAAPNIVYIAGNKAEFRSGTSARQIDACIESDLSVDPIEHIVAVKITNQPQSKTPTVSALPRMRVVAGEIGAVLVTEADGNELDVNVFVERVKPAK